MTSVLSTFFLSSSCLLPGRRHHTLNLMYIELEGAYDWSYQLWTFHPLSPPQPILGERNFNLVLRSHYWVHYYFEISITCNQTKVQQGHIHSTNNYLLTQVHILPLLLDYIISLPIGILSCVPARSMLLSREQHTEILHSE